MFWNDIEEIKESLNRLIVRIDVLDQFVRTSIINGEFSEKSMPVGNGAPVCIRCDGDRVIDAGIEDIKELLQEFFDNDYMKNVDKLNAMINEFKGCVAMSRAALNEKKSRKPRKLVKKKKGSISPAL
jgi:hypothetical protein